MAEIYDQCAVALNGEVIANATTVSVEFVDNDHAIALLGGGSRTTMGNVVGGRMMRVSFDVAVPSSTNAHMRDVGLIERYIDAQTVSLQVFLQGSGKSLKSVGQLQSPSVRAAVAQSMSLMVAVPVIWNRPPSPRLTVAADATSAPFSHRAASASGVT